MPARDELVREVINGSVKTALDGRFVYLDALIARRIADALLAAGYRKPRTITTIAELDAMPGATVVKDALEQVFEKQESGQWHEGPHDWLAFDGKFWDVDAIHLPATVLYEPDPS